MQSCIWLVQGGKGRQRKEDCSVGCHGNVHLPERGLYPLSIEPFCELQSSGLDTPQDFNPHTSQHASCKEGLCIRKTPRTQNHLHLLYAHTHRASFLRTYVCARDLAKRRSKCFTTKMANIGVCMVFISVCVNESV